MELYRENELVLTNEDEEQELIFGENNPDMEQFNEAIKNRVPKDLSVFDKVENEDYTESNQRSAVQFYVFANGIPMVITLEQIKRIIGSTGGGTLGGIKFRVEGESLEVSYDDGETWTAIGIVKGETGEDGADGRDGVDGKTPYIQDGYWYINGVNTNVKAEGVDGSNGKDGADGADGVSATHSWNGTTLTITSASGTSSANLKGEKGDKGEQGIQGTQGVQGIQGEQGIRGAKGDKGDKGDGFSIAKTYPSIAAMNAGYSTDGVPLNGFVLINTGNVNDADNAKLFVKLENGYSYLTDLSGSQGIQGEKGEKGEQGIQGEKGIQGEQGIQGVQGVQGEKGADGTNGTNGKDGTSVTVKSVSESTADGGSNVVTFSDGKTLTVKNGSKGSKGDKGDTGPTGANGKDGTNGTNGKDGKSAYQYAKDGGFTGTENEFAQKIAKIDQDNATQDTAILGEELANANNWTLGAGWSGSFASGFTHTSGNTEPLTFTPTITAGKLYQVTFKSSVRMTITNLFVQVGGSTQFNLYGEDITNDTGNVSIGVLAINTNGLVFTPESTFTGTLTNISLKEITGSYEAVQQYFDTNEAVAFEIHITPRGLENVFIGQATGEMNTTGHENVGVGVNVLSQNTSGFWNVGIGKDCLKNNTGGSRNLALGYNALMSNEVGQRNVALGTFTMTQMKNGNWNIAIGSDSMNEATGGNKNVAVGFNTLVHNSGDNNVAVGADVLSQNTSGAGNIGIGQGALAKNTTGINNVCIGYNAGTAQTTAAGNVGVGWATLYKTTTGAKNTAIGYGAGKSITTGKNNIVIGAEKEVDATGNYQLNIGDLLKGSLVSGASYLLINGGLRLPSIPTSATGNADEVYAEEWTFTLEDGSTVTKKVLMK